MRKIKKIRKKALTNMTKEREGFVTQNTNDAINQRTRFKSTNRKIRFDLNYALWRIVVKSFNISLVKKHTLE